VLARILPFARPELPRLGLGVFIALLANAFALGIPLALERLVDGPLAEGDQSAIWPAVGLVALLGLLEALFVFFRRVTVLTPGTRIDARVRNAIYDHLQDLPVAFHDRWQSGQLLSRAHSDVSLIRRWVSFGAIALLANSIAIVLGVAILFVWSPLLAGVFLLSSLPMFVFGSRFENAFTTLSRRAQDQWGDVATSVEESVHGIRVLKAFGRGPFALGRFSHQVARGRELEVEKGRVLATLEYWLTWIPDFASAACLLFGVYLSAEGQLSTGELFAFFATAAVLAGPIASFGYLLALTYEARSGIERIMEVLDTPNPIVSPASPARAAQQDGSLVFEDVHFRFDDTNSSRPDLLRGVSLEVRPGETMALVGLTGSGKTTLTALPARLYDVTGGRVLVGGTDVRDIDLVELRTTVAMAFEDATLFSASVRENVLLGRPDLGPHSDDAIRVVHEALDVAEAQFAFDLPDGIDTLIGEQGLSLSGGQRQRLALARAIAARPQVLVLDDPLSALDVATEARVEAALRKVLATTTALVVAHRPSTVMLADRVALLQDGLITAVGTHHELLETSSAYRHVISSLANEDQGPRVDTESLMILDELEAVARESLEREAKGLESDGGRAG
jgi:ATP-binding cassette subfamily B protein